MTSQRDSIPALVSPGPALTVDEVRRYSRHLIIPDVAMTGQQRLMNAKVLCVGAGGLGSPALMYLAAAGIGTLGIVEFDTVDESNLQRQIIHGQSDIGKSKAQSAKEKISEINPYVNIALMDKRAFSGPNTDLATAVYIQNLHLLEWCQVVPKVACSEFSAQPLDLFKLPKR
jgi:molybdopterin/thiamine biosynthesis adenylyltransferase